MAPTRDTARRERALLGAAMKRFVLLTAITCTSLLLLPFSLIAQSSVTIAGDLQTELGCSGDWDPSCSTTFLTYSAASDVWKGTFNVPGGNWQYKAALNTGWDLSYGL